MTTLDLANTVQFGISQYTGERTVRYAACPHCGSDIHRYPRMAWPRGYQSYAKCECGWAVWEWEETAAILARLGVARELTMVSGYSTQFPEPPQANVCVFCNDGPCTLLCEPPADEREYVRQFRDGAFDEALAGYVTVDTGDPISIDLPIHKHFTFGRLFERLLEDGKRNG